MAVWNGVEPLELAECLGLNLWCGSCGRRILDVSDDKMNGKTIIDVQVHIATLGYTPSILYMYRWALIYPREFNHANLSIPSFP